MVIRVLARWLQLAGLATALFLMIYLSAQQVMRQMANDPQLAMARDARDQIAHGASAESVVPQAQIDIARSYSPWVMVTDDTGRVVASSMRLHGALRPLPRGVYDDVRANGENDVTWMPEPAVRMATVTLMTPGAPTRFITVGRSLALSEDRTSRIGSMILVGWILTLVGLLVLVALSEAFLIQR